MASFSSMHVMLVSTVEAEVLVFQILLSGLSVDFRSFTSRSVVLLSFVHHQSCSDGDLHFERKKGLLVLL